MKNPLHLRLRKFALVWSACLALGSLCAARAEALLTVPDQSPRATVSERIGLTDITVRYHRPLVGGRKIWGALVPYGQVWRAGANENTTIEFSDPVTIEDQKLPKGTYGLHTIPTADAWTIIFSKNSSSWGSFNYDKGEDALRVTVKPQPSEPATEALSYSFDDVKPNSAVLTLRWEKLAVPIRIAVKDEDSTLPNLRDQLRGDAQWFWSPWNDAANYCLTNKLNLEEALRWIDHSLSLEERFENLDTKAGILTALNRPADAKAVHDRAMEIGSASQIYFYARGLQAKGETAEAMDLFRNVMVKRFPQHWTGHLAQARLLSAAGDFPGAAKEVKAALALLANASDAQKKAVQGLIDKLEKNQDINK